LVVTMSSCGIMPVTSADKKSDRTAVESSLVPDLQRQIREREKRIAELEAQLEALKLIDQDMEKRRQFSRPPATLTPIE
jgi:hypothetical protein